MNFLNSILKRTFLLLIPSLLILLLVLPIAETSAKTPPEIRNQDELQIKKDMHGEDLSGFEFIKLDLRGFNFSGANLSGAIFNNSQLQGADLSGADLQDAVAFASDFDGADLSDANFTQALLMESHFKGAEINSADFTDAVVSRIQLKELCAIAEGTNSSSGVETSYSLGC